MMLANTAQLSVDARFEALSQFVTQGQKQALVDNLQLEITERARKLRAQYALHAQSLRSRLEMRVNRIPHALRKANIKELLDKHEGSKRNEAQNKVAFSNGAQKFHPRGGSPVVTMGSKRSSAELMSDKENGHEDLSVPRKRTKIASASTKVQSSSTDRYARPNSRTARTVSRKATTSKPLSPRLANARAIPTPVRKPTSPVKPTGLSHGPPSALPIPSSPIKFSNAMLAPPKPPPRGASRGVTHAPISASTSTVSRGRKATGLATATVGMLKSKVSSSSASSVVASVLTSTTGSQTRVTSNSSDESAVTAATSTTTSTTTKAVAQKLAVKPTAGKRGLAGRMAGATAAAGRRAAAAVTGGGAKKAAEGRLVGGGRVLRSRK